MDMVKKVDEPTLALGLNSKNFYWHCTKSITLYRVMLFEKQGITEPFRLQYHPYYSLSGTGHVFVLSLFTL